MHISNISDISAEVGVEIFHVSRFSQFLKFGDTYIHHSTADSIISFNSRGKSSP